jgi:hypothetical protein
LSQQIAPSPLASGVLAAKHRLKRADNSIVRRRRMLELSFEATIIAHHNPSANQ